MSTTTEQLASLKLRIDTPTEELLPGPGFYQLEEEALYVQVAAFDSDHRFFSYLESPHVRFDLDREGRLLFIEVDYARRHWQVDHTLTYPEQAQPADIRWLDFRKSMTDPEIIANENRTLLLLRFTPSVAVSSYRVAEKVTVDVTDTAALAAVWVADIVDDLAGRSIAAYRKRLAPW